MVLGNGNSTLFPVCDSYNLSIKHVNIQLLEYKAGISIEYVYVYILKVFFSF